MKDLASIGRRLRGYRMIAYLVGAIGIFLNVSGVASYWDNGPPSRWVMGNDVADGSGRFGPDTGGRYLPIPPDDPDYLVIVRSRESHLMYMLLWGSSFLAAGALAYGASRKPPTKGVLLLAQARNGLLTLPEISTTLDIDPHLAAAALRQLQKLHIATPRWQEIRKNLWEFPDYMTLPISESLDMAKDKDGRLSVEDLMAAGHSRETACETLNMLGQKGLAQPEHGGESSAVVVTAQ